MIFLSGSNSEHGVWRDSGVVLVAYAAVKSWAIRAERRIDARAGGAQRNVS